MEEKENNDINEFINKNKSKKKIKISSDAFPPKSVYEGKKIQPAYSNIHKFLTNEKIEITQSMIKFRKIVKADMVQVRPLFREWFPLDYDNSFYEKIFLRQEDFSGLTLIAYIENPKFSKQDISKENNNTNINYKIEEISNSNLNENFFEFPELIIGIIITNRDPLENYINKVPYKFENLSFLDEISFSSKYFVYVQSLGVIDECRRLKIGSLLLNQIIEISNLDYHCLGIYLHVVVYNSTAIKFYEKNNFKEMNHLYNYYLIEGNYYDSKVMVRLFQIEEKKLNESIVLKFLEKVVINPLKILVLILTLCMCCKRYRHIKKLKKQ